MSWRLLPALSCLVLAACSGRAPLDGIWSTQGAVLELCAGSGRFSMRDDYHLEQGEWRVRDDQLELITDGSERQLCLPFVLSDDGDRLATSAMNDSVEIGQDCPPGRDTPLEWERTTVELLRAVAEPICH
jgi:hypothetical protein